MKKTVMLIILDGWGYREEKTHNAVAQSKTPFFNLLWEKYPHTLLKASGNAVGLPEGQMGNSEVGHTTIGAGIVLDTDLVRIEKAATAGEFSKNSAMNSLFDHVKNNDSTLHVIGLVSDGGVHSHENHMHAFLHAAKKANVSKVAIHFVTDGRDTPPQSAGGYMKKLLKELQDIDPTGRQFFIASISGRYFAMDRDNNWDRLAKAEQAIFEGTGPSTKLAPLEYLEDLYVNGAKDEWIEPITIEGVHGKGSPISKHDGIFFFNFRSDRARMISQKMIERIANHAKENSDLKFVTMTEYSSEYTFPVAFLPIKIETTLAAEISKAGGTQAHIAETEKFPHATYYLNGGRNEPHPGEAHIGLASRKDVKTHDEAPEMRAEAIADKAIEEIEKGIDFIFINFANPDVVGHTANVPAIVRAIETVDTQLGRVITALEKKGGVAFITADHGNAEVNIDPITGTKHTAHTINPVPAILTDASQTLKTGGLADIAPTILDLLDIKKPQQMSGVSLLK